MAQREHEMLFRLNAQMNSAYQATFRSAQQAMGQFREEYNSLSQTARDISGYQRQQQAVENTRGKLQLLQTQYENIQKEISETGTFSSDLENKLAAKGAQIEKTSKALEDQTEKLNQYGNSLQEAGVDTDNLEGESQRLQAEMDGMRRSFDEAGQSAEEFGEDAGQSFGDLEQMLAGVGLVALSKEISGYLKDCAEAAQEFEAGMAGVRRTVGGTQEEMAAMGQQFLEMSTYMPITAQELTEIATTAGQLGIAQKDVEEFTQIMAQLATTTDLSADMAATMLAQFSNITGTKDYARLGSTVAALGDATATTASKVVEMSQGMAASATVAGMSERDILALAASVGSLGIQAQAGSSSMSQLINKLYTAVETGDGLEEFAEIANMSAAEFKTAWGQNAIGAMNAFIQGLNDTERNGRSAIVVLNELGITNVRQTKAILSLASAGDLLTNTIQLANRSWNENTALQEKAGIMYETSQAKLTMMQNNFHALKIAVGDQYNPALARLYEILGNAAKAMTEFTKAHPEAAKALTALAAGLALTVAGFGAYIVALKAAKTVTDTLGGPIAIVDLALTALAATLAILVVASADAEDALGDMRDAVGDMDHAVADANERMASTRQETEAAAMTAGIYIDRLEELEQAGTATGESQEEYRATVEELNRLIPDLNAQIDEQTGLVAGGTDALRQNTEAWKQNAITQALMETQTETMKAWAELQLEVSEKQDQLNQVQEEGAGIADSIARKEQAVADAMRLRSQLTEENCGSTEEFLRRQQEYDDQIYALQNDLGELAQEQERNRDEQEVLTMAIDEGTEAMNRYEGQMARAEEQARAFAEGTEEGADATESMLGPLDSVMASLEELSAEYGDAYMKALESIQGQMALWDEAPDVTANTVEEINKALESQTQYWTDYSDNLSNLNQRNIDGLDEYVRSVADGSSKSAAYIAGLSSASDEELTAIVANLQALGEAQGTAAEGMADVQTGFSERLEGIVSDTEAAVGSMDLSGDARAAAQATVNAYIQQAQVMVGQVRSAYAAVANAAKEGINYGSMTVIPRSGDIGRVGYAEGTESAEAGWHWVGENGPELMRFQGGEEVLPHTKSLELVREAEDSDGMAFTYAPVYQISGGANADELRAVLEEHDRQLPGRIRDFLRTERIDARRRAYA